MEMKNQPKSCICMIKISLNANPPMLQKCPEIDHIWARNRPQVKLNFSTMDILFHFTFSYPFSYYLIQQIEYMIQFIYNTNIVQVIQII